MKKCIQLNKYWSKGSLGGGRSTGSLRKKRIFWSTTRLSSSGHVSLALPERKYAAVSVDDITVGSSIGTRPRPPEVKNASTLDHREASIDCEDELRSWIPVMKLFSGLHGTSIQSSWSRELSGFQSKLGSNIAPGTRSSCHPPCRTFLGRAGDRSSQSGKGLPEALATAGTVCRGSGPGACSPRPTALR